MIKFLTTIILTIAFSTSHAQSDKIVKWTTSYDAEKSEIVFIADIQKTWVMYSQHTDPEGPIPLSFEFEKSEEVTFEGKVEEKTKPMVEMSEMFGVNVIKFKDKAEFRQKIKGASSGTTIKGNVSFMTCDAEKCLPPVSVPFAVKL